MDSVNPFNGKLIRQYRNHTDGEVDAIVIAAANAQNSWCRTDFSSRASLMSRAADILDQRAELYGTLITAEMGKTLTESSAEVRKCASVCRYYAENAETQLAPVEIPTEATRSFVAYQPLGVVLAVMPWNFPFWQVLRFAAPALMAGNAGILKHASNVPGCALAIEEVFRDAGFPNGLFGTVLVGGSKVSRIIENPIIKAVTLTGSTPAGQAVAAKAGQMIKKAVLELGGSDPYVILEDADLPMAAASCAASRLLNSGQSCIAAKRFIVVEKVAQQFTELLIGEMKARSMGNPMAPGIDMGPMARIDLRDEVHQQVVDSVSAGAKLVLGGEIPVGTGAFYPATVLTNVIAGMVAYKDEIFGPVASVIIARDEADAIRIANDTHFGLGAAVFTSDLDRGIRIAREELDAGSCFVNDFVKSDPRLPFGGIKESGYGRELHALGIREFMNAKTVVAK